MHVIKKSSKGIQTIPLDAALLAQRTIFLTGPITMEAADQILRQLLHLTIEDDRSLITLIINSPGGDVDAGLMLYDQMKGMDVPIDIYCVGVAAGIAAVLLAGGKCGHRFILEHSKVTVCEPVLSSNGGTIGSAASVRKTAESILETKSVLIGLLSLDTGHAISEIEKVLSCNTVMNAEDAVEYGICDSIVTRVEKGELI